jgi:RNase P subunit RPR2
MAKKLRLIIKKSNKEEFKRVSCKHCGNLLFRETGLQKSISESGERLKIEIKCRKCKEINLF